jgi:aminoglycoside phosphotransferase (APT) family kinase protein
MAHVDRVLADLTARLETYLRRRLPSADRLAVSGLARISGGASRETFRFVLDVSTDGRAERRRLILRRDPSGSLIDTDRRIEFAALGAFHGGAVPVPAPLWLEEATEPLGHPFFIMAEIEGGEANPLRLMAPPYLALHAQMAAQKWRILGEIARTDPVACGLAAAFAPIDPNPVWQTELDRWVKVLDEDEIEPQPIQRAAIRWLRRHPPPSPRRLSVVHGDYRTGNLLIGPAGDVLGVLDWEMVHLGDPLEDLAWGINRVWCFLKDERVGGLVTRAEAIRIWEAASGLTAEPAALHWWELFSCVKGQAIWVSAAQAFESGRNRDLIMPIAAWMQANTQDRAALELMGHLP